MSINDLLNDDSFLPIVFFAFFITAIILIIAVPIGIAKGKSTNQKIYGDDEENLLHDVVRVRAKLIAKQTQPHPLNQAVTIHTALFELQDGSRLSFAIQDLSVLELLLEGDTGILCYQGKKFINFVRERNLEN